MAGSMSLTEVVANLEAQIAFHREREAFHAAEKARHTEEQARHAAELELLTQRLETFTTAVALVQPVLRVPEPEPAAVQAQRDEDLGTRVKISRAVDRVIDDQPAGAAFGASQVAAEVNRRFAGKLRRPINARTVSPLLRRRHRLGFLVCVREGRPAHEGQFRKKAAK